MNLCFSEVKAVFPKFKTFFRRWQPFSEVMIFISEDRRVFSEVVPYISEVEALVPKFTPFFQK